MSQPLFSSPDDILQYDGFDPDDEALRETLTSTGNGYFCTRGTAEWEDTSEHHYAGTYAHGIFNREASILSGHPVLNEDMVNLPNWLPLRLSIDGEDPISLASVEILSYTHRLELANDLLVREVRFRDRAGRETELVSRRFVSMRRMHQAGISWQITPVNWSGKVTIISGLDGRVLNRGVERYRALQGRHLDPVGPRVFSEDVIALKARTRQSRIEIAEAARTRVYVGEHLITVERETFQMEDYIHQLLHFDVQQGEQVTVEKMVSLFTSHDRAIHEPLISAGKVVARYGRFDGELEASNRAWDELWQVCDVRLHNNRRVQFLLRLHICHLLQVCSRHTAQQDAGVPARGLNGEAYRGHIFWDEMYVFPFLNFRLPQITRSLLMYRYRRLGEARAAARALGLRGAMFPWQSGSDGQEETQEVHLNPMSGKWDPDLSRNQRHVNAAIFYNVWNYFQTTEDVEFLRDNGAEIMIEITRFWASLAHFNEARGRWEIHGVMGPDEFHEKYPGAEEGGLRNNAYTNVMVAWICRVAHQVIHMLPLARRVSLMAKIGMSEDELIQWDSMSRKMFVPFTSDGIISQFEGYDELEELDWEAYRQKYGNIQRLDRILKAEGSDPDRYKLAKQGDVVMLFFLFSDDQLERLFRRLGYEFSPETARRNVEYYDERTSHGSTLSHVTFAGVLASIDPVSSWERFKIALESDIGDIQGGTTREGVHLGVMAGTLDLLQRAYLGTEVRNGVMHINPQQREHLDGLSLLIQFRRAALQLTYQAGLLSVFHEPEAGSAPVRIAVAGEVHQLASGDRRVFDLDTIPAPPHRNDYTAVLFDVVGLLIDTPHAQAWSEAYDELMATEWAELAEQIGHQPGQLTYAVYLHQIAGLPRDVGAATVLHHFGVTDAAERAEQLALRKQDKLAVLLEAGKFKPHPDALRFLLAAKARGLRVAAASASKNTALMLRHIRVDDLAREMGIDEEIIRPGATLTDVFDVDVSPREFQRGKPDAEIFLSCAAELEMAPEDCLVLEDSHAGVRAARAAGMDVIAVARHDDEWHLAQADLVVTSLDHVDMDAVERRVLVPLNGKPVVSS